MFIMHCGVCSLSEFSLVHFITKYSIWVFLSWLSYSFIDIVRVSLPLSFYFCLCVPSPFLPLCLFFTLFAACTFHFCAVSMPTH